jgi:hypothetical protein
MISHQTFVTQEIDDVKRKQNFFPLRFGELKNRFRISFFFGEELLEVTFNDLNDVSCLPVLSFLFFPCLMADTSHDEVYPTNQSRLHDKSCNQAKHTHNS